MGAFVLQSDLFTDINDRDHCYLIFCKSHSPYQCLFPKNFMTRMLSYYF